MTCTRKTVAPGEEDDRMTDTTTAGPETPAIDWTQGGKKPERDGQRCANPDCGQILMLVRPDRKFCARCDRAAGRDPHASICGL